MPYRFDPSGKARLELLQTARRASPCPASWDDHMCGDGPVRRCGVCHLTVYDVSLSPLDELIRWVGGTGDRSARLFKRRDGKVLTSDCPFGVNRKRRRRLGLAATGAALAACVWMWLGPPALPALRPGPVPPHVGYELHLTPGHPSSGQGFPEGMRLEMDPPAPPPNPRAARSPCIESPTCRSREFVSRSRPCACVPGDPLCSCL